MASTPISHPHEVTHRQRAVGSGPVGVVAAPPVLLFQPRPNRRGFSFETKSRNQVMAHGGKREGAGRKPGASTRMNEAARAAAAEGGLMPLDYLLSVMRDEGLPRPDRVDAAKAAAPYVHAKLASVEHKGGLELTTQTKEQRDAAVAAATRADS